MLVKEEAIVLRCIDYRDTSQIITLFGKNSGKIGLIAKGSKRKKNPNEGILEALNCLSFVYYQKPHGQLGVLKECDLENFFPKIRQKLEKLFLAFYFIEMTNEFLPECDPNIKLFQLLKYSLNNLCSDEISQKTLCLYWNWHSLNLLGLAPNFFQCSGCFKLLNEIKSNYVFFSPQSNGILCNSCKKNLNCLKMGLSSFECLNLIIYSKGNSWKKISVSDEIYKIGRAHV